MSQHFILQPFTSNNPISDLQITGNIARADNNLNLNYQLLGNLSPIKIPPVTEKPTRQDRLWETTCLEFFLGIKNSPKYWEFNLSPAKHWNIYRFNDYRQNMREETALNTLPFAIKTQPHSLNLSLKLDLDPIITLNQQLEISITAVIERDRHLTYWALTHPCAKPDFHLRDSFIINL